MGQHCNGRVTSVNLAPAGRFVTELRLSGLLRAADNDSATGSVIRCWPYPCSIIEQRCARASSSSELQTESRTALIVRPAQTPTIRLDPEEHAGSTVKAVPRMENAAQSTVGIFIGHRRLLFAGACDGFGWSAVSGCPQNFSSIRQPFMVSGPSQQTNSEVTWRLCSLGCANPQAGPRSPLFAYKHHRQHAIVRQY